MVWLYYGKGPSSSGILNFNMKLYYFVIEFVYGRKEPSFKTPLMAVNKQKNERLIG